MIYRQCRYLFLSSPSICLSEFLCTRRVKAADELRTFYRSIFPHLFFCLFVFCLQEEGGGGGGGDSPVIVVVVEEEEGKEKGANGGQEEEVMDQQRQSPPALVVTPCATERRSSFTGIEGRSRSRSVGERQWTRVRAVMTWYTRLRRIKK